MPIKLPNGKYRVQIRVKGHPRIDQVFDAKKSATDFEKTECERLERKPSSRDSWSTTRCAA
jgi:hypothetical protein